MDADGENVDRHVYHVPKDGVVGHAKDKDDGGNDAHQSLRDYFAHLALHYRLNQCTAIQFDWRQQTRLLRLVEAETEEITFL